MLTVKECDYKIKKDGMIFYEISPLGCEPKYGKFSQSNYDL